MGRPELDDVTDTRLKMRPGIEKEIETVIVGCGFRRVTSEEMNITKELDGLDSKKKQDAVTAWNRTLHLYERVADDDNGSI